MNSKIFFTHYWVWEQDSSMYPSRFREFAECGAKHIVLTDDLIRIGMENLPALVKIKKQLEEAGLTFADAHAPFGHYCDLSLPLEEYRPLMILQNSFVLKLCSVMGVKTCTIHLGNVSYNSFYPLERFDEYSRRSLEQLLPVAEKYNVILNIENVWNQLARVETILKLVDFFQNPYLGVCFDAGHANVLRSSMKKEKEAVVYKSWGTEGKWGPIPWDDHILEKLLPHIVTCHLHDNNGLSDQHYLPFTGTIDWKHVTGLLAKAPQLQCVQNEAIPSRSVYSVHDACRVFDKIREMMENHSDPYILDSRKRITI